jgi:hypothetical protein
VDCRSSRALAMIASTTEDLLSTQVPDIATTADATLYCQSSTRTGGGAED